MIKVKGRDAPDSIGEVPWIPGHEPSTNYQAGVNVWLVQHQPVHDARWGIIFDHRSGAARTERP